MPSQLETNLAALPETCYGTLESDGSLILIKRGETGYFPTEGYTINDTVPTFTMLADMLNERRGCTREQRMAMEAGSMFGFELPIAHPDNHRLSVLIMDLDGVDPALGQAARDMRREGAPHEEIVARFKAVIAEAAKLRETA